MRTRVLVFLALSVAILWLAMPSAYAVPDPPSSILAGLDHMWTYDQYVNGIYGPLDDQSTGQEAIVNGSLATHTWNLQYVNLTGQGWSDFHVRIVSDSIAEYYLSFQSGTINAGGFGAGGSLTISGDHSQQVDILGGPVGPNGTVNISVVVQNASLLAQPYHLEVWPTVPEPSSLVAMFSGLLVMGGVIARKRRHIR